MIEIYPATPRPKWLRRGRRVLCRGEGNEVFVVDQVCSRGSRAFLCHRDGYAHGWESFAKLSVVAQ